MEPRFLLDFADDRVRHRFSDLDGPAGQPPLAAVGAPLQQEPAATVEDDYRDAGPNTEGPCVITL